MEIVGGILQRTRPHVAVRKEATLHNTLSAPEACERHGISLVYPQVAHLGHALYVCLCATNNAAAAHRAQQQPFKYGHTQRQ